MTHNLGSHKVTITSGTIIKIIIILMPHHLFNVPLFYIIIKASIYMYIQYKNDGIIVCTYRPNHIHIKRMTTVYPCVYIYIYVHTYSIHIVYVYIKHNSLV